MKAIKFATFVAILSGALWLVYGSFNYAKEPYAARLVPIEPAPGDKPMVDVSPWAWEEPISLQQPDVIKSLQILY